MLTENETTLLTNIASAVGESAEFVISQYTTWHFVNAVGWLVFGIFAILSVTKIKFDKDSEIAIWAQFFIKAVLILISATIILSSVPDVASPKAAAIHQLLKDVRSK